MAIVIIVTRMRFSFVHFGFYSPSRLVVHMMEELLVELLLRKMYDVKSKVGPLCICCVVVWLVSVYGETWGQLEKSTPPPVPPPKVEGVELQADGSFNFH